MREFWRILHGEVNANEWAIELDRGLVLQRANLLLSLREVGLELDAESLAHGGPVAAVLPREDEEDHPVVGPQVG